MIGLIAVTAAGRGAAERLARAWPRETRGYPGPAAEALPQAWDECEALVCFLATGATVRLIAPLLAGKRTDPAVVCVDEASRHAIALLGGHGPGGDGRPGANGLAARVADVLGAEPVLSTATDQAGLPGLDTLGWPVEGAVAAVSRAMLDGDPVRLDSDATWPLPAFPPNVRLAPNPGADSDEAGESDGVYGTDGAHGTVEVGVGVTGLDSPGVGNAGVGGTGSGDTGLGDTGPGGTGSGGTGSGGTGSGGTGSGGTGSGGTGSGGTGSGGTGLGDTGLGGAGLGDTRPGNTGPGDAGSGGTGLGGAGGGERVLVTDRVVPVDGRTVVLRPPSLAVGVGASRGVSAAEVLGLIHATLAGAGLSPLSVAGLATVDAKADEPGLTEAAALRGWTLTTYPAGVLAVVDVPHPSEAARAAVGTPSVAEAAALTRGDVLVAAKQKSAMATAAVARIRPRGRLALVGLGPGARDLLPPRAVTELRRASVVAGLDQYLDQVRDLLRPGTRVLASGLGDEEERARMAVAEAQRGCAVALVGSGDAGVYSMASPALSLAGGDIDVVTVPGITANLAAAALLGAPLGHDHAVISLSDLNTPWPVIERRVRAAAEGDFVVTFYNPRSRARDWQLRAALDLLGAHRPASTPAAIVRNANRPGQLITVTTLGKLDTAAVDMLSLVLVGGSTTQMVAGRMVTPRGYPWQP
jgi:cobalt-precorrin 5A hydrolase / precorrin-3B C17-methyltransferase